MSTERILDGRLRPLYEIVPIITAMIAGLITFALGDYFFLGNNERAIMYAICAAVILWRTVDLVRVKLYQMSLNDIDPFFIATDEIMHSKDKTWIGRGFVWTNEHSQRVWDANKANLKKYYQLPRMYHWFRANELAVELAEGHNIENQYQVEEEFENPEHKSPKDIDPRKLKVTKLSYFIAMQTKKSHWFNGRIKNPYKPIPPVGGVAAYHAVGFEEEEDQYTTLDERNGHSITFGQSRVGKTRFLEFMVSQDIERNDSCVGVFDPKGDIELLGRMWAEAKRANREDEFYIFSLGHPDISAKFNAIASFSRITAVAGRISENMQSSGDGQVFKDFAWRFLLLVAQSVVDMGEKPTFKSMKQHIEDLEPLFNRYGKFVMKRDNPKFEEEWNDAMTPKYRTNAKGEQIEVKIPVGAMKGRKKETVVLDYVMTSFYERNPHLINQAIEGLRTSMKNDQSNYIKLTASLLPLLVQLTTGRIAELLSPNYQAVYDNRAIFSWKKIIQRKGVFYCGFDAMTDKVVASAVGKMFFSDLVSEAGEIYKHGINKGLPGSDSKDVTPIWLHCDEFQSLVNDDTVPMLNRAAGAGVRVAAYTQVISDIEDAIGDVAKAKVILGNFNSVYMMRVAQKETAEYLTDKLPSVDYWGLDVQGGVSDSGRILTESNEETGEVGSNMFSTRTSAGVQVEAHEPVITPATIMSLPKGQAFAFLNGQRLVKLRFPLLKDAKGYEISSGNQIFKEYAEKYHLDEWKNQYVA